MHWLYVGLQLRYISVLLYWPTFIHVGKLKQSCGCDNRQCFNYSMDVSTSSNHQHKEI